MMKKYFVILAVSLLLAVPSFAQNKLAMGIDQHIGIGLGGASPVVFGNTSFVIQYTFAKYFQVGAGAGLRYGVSTRSYNLGTGAKERAFELDVPIFLRAGVKLSIVSLKLDVGYAPGLKAWAFNLKEGVSRELHYNGFFFEPHIDLGGDRNAVGVGGLLQNCSYEEIPETGVTPGQNVQRLLPALTLRYSRYF